ncbi:cobalt/nickel transport system permease protein [Caldanaerobius fijiensis DSM 17918]|uniref:Cobalt/nickel transport system permease protein n=1 Tax=Caldanaerobius fijiensis DSM 17918 TaxID=1121256 RepID=A0A1M4YLF3_9THEO|nr:cobalt ECF transporter T component CbiQ [Caldanaerobius fijiensis]SHF06655.1 cobalt/nickel transport system permease protein [Caldanaerobius fijiensis DSM 17918]
MPIDRYAYINRLRHVHPGEKIFFAFAMMLLSFIPNIYINIAIIIIIASISILRAGIPLRFYLKLMSLPLTFLFMGIITILFGTSNKPDVFIIYMRIAHIYIGLSKKGVATGILLFSRSLSIVSCLYFISLTTPMPEFMSVLKKMKVPSLLLDLMELIYRFLFVLIETAEQIYISQDSRLGYISFKTALNSLAYLISVLFIKSYTNAEQLYIAMESRCYNGDIRLLENSYKISYTNIAFIAFTVFTLIALVLWTGGYTS